MAERKIRAEAELRGLSEEIAMLPFARQNIVSDLAALMTSVNGHIIAGAAYAAKSANHLSRVVHSRVMQIDDAKPLDEDNLRDIAMLTKLANESASTTLAIMAMHKEMLKPDKPSVPLGLSHFYGDNSKTPTPEETSAAYLKMIG